MREAPTKNRKKVVRKDPLPFLKESTQLGCVSQDSYPRKSILREPGKWWSTHAVKILKDTWHQIKIRERKGPSRGILSTSVSLMSVVLARQNSRIDHMRKP